LEERCIDCGECIKICPHGAITPKTDSFDTFSNYKYTVAIPSPTIFTQFGKEVTPKEVIYALKRVGFDDVYHISWECEAIFRAIREHVNNHQGRYPLISSSCPVIIRLIQVNYPEMVDQIISLDVPKEIAAKKIKKEISELYNIKPEEVGTIYITPCASKIISIKQPAEKDKSNVDAAISIGSLYNDLYAELAKMKKDKKNTQSEEDFKNSYYINQEIPFTKNSIYWAIVGGEGRVSGVKDWVNVAGLQNVINTFDDIEKGKIKNVKYVECYSCQGGCVGGTLTVENVYIARSTALYLLDILPELSNAEKLKMMEIYKTGAFSPENKINPRFRTPTNIIDAIKKKKQKDDLIRRLPHVECGLCGAPTCNCFAEDVVNGLSNMEDCFLYAGDKLDNIIKRYKNDMKT